MGYYHIKLCLQSKRLCTIILSWVKYEYQKLSMSLCNGLDILQEKMNELFSGLEYVRICIYDLLIVSNESFKDHLHKIDKIFKILLKAGFQINAEISFFARDELEYLSFQIATEGIMSLPDKVQAITSLDIPKTKKQLRSVIGLIRHYRDMWKSRSDILTPLSSMTSRQDKWDWNIKYQQVYHVKLGDVMLCNNYSVAIESERKGHEVH